MRTVGSFFDGTSGGGRLCVETFFLGMLCLAGLLVGATACRRPPEPPRGVDENPPIEDISEHPVEHPPESVRVLAENDLLAVTEARLAPGSRLTLHREGERVVYARTACSLRFTPRSQPDRSTVRSLRAGQAARCPSGALTVESSGASEARFVVVTRSSQPAPVEAGEGPGLAGSRGARELFRDREVSVGSLTLAAGGAISVADGPLEVIQSLGPGGLRLETDEAAGSIDPGTGPVYIVAGRYRVSNPGSRPVRLIAFGFHS
jgi:hypothetical protein